MYGSNEERNIELKKNQKYTLYITYSQGFGKYRIKINPGHNSFVKDEQGNDLMVYHARSRACFEGKCGYAGNDPLYDPCRHARIRRIIWSALK
mgnify:CR=1 FL=1